MPRLHQMGSCSSIRITLMGRQKTKLVLYFPKYNHLSFNLVLTFRSFVTLTKLLTL